MFFIPISKIRKIIKKIVGEKFACQIVTCGCDSNNNKIIIKFFLLYLKKVIKIIKEIKDIKYNKKLFLKINFDKL